MNAFKSLLLVLTFVLPQITLASQKFENVSDIEVFKDKAESLGEKHGTDKVLLVYDVDNTLLAMNQEFGSDQWFSWQSRLLSRSKGKSKYLVAPDMNGLLRVLNMAYFMSDMHPPQAELPEMVKELQAAGYPSIVLTSRGPRSRNATVRVLMANGYDFSNSAIGPKGGYPSKFEPYNYRNPKQDGFSSAEIKRFKLTRKARMVSYQDGIFMGSGQHKGAMLRLLLKKTGASAKAILFLDDHKKNTDRVFEAFRGKPYDVYTYRYSKEDEKRDKFLKGSKMAAIKSWNKFKSALAIFKAAQTEAQAQASN